MYHQCQVIRRKLQKTKSLNLETGEYKNIREEWLTEICGTLLFKPEEIEAGECKSCKDGWETPMNYRVKPEE